MQRLEDLPVSVDLPGMLGQEVVAFVEGEAGWQVVHPGGPLAPVLTITGQACDVACVVVTDGPPVPDQVRTALLAGALDVIGWPQDRQRLLEAPLRVRATSRRAPGPAEFRVAGAGGGVGASTVALAVGGLVGWSGRPAIVVGDDDLLALCGCEPWSQPGAPEIAALDPADAAVEVAALARPVPGVEKLRVLGGGAAGVDTAGWPADLVVMDLRALGPAATTLRPQVQETLADLVVARADHRLRTLAGTPAGMAVAVVDGGPLERRGARQLLGRPPVGWLPHSARVARAGLQGRVPAGLPGSWLAALRTTLERVRR